MTPYSELLSRAVVDSRGLGVDVPDDWMQGRSVFGGLQVALTLRAMRELCPGPPLRTVQATFVGPIAGRIEVRARVLRVGKSATQVEGHILSGDTVATLVTAIFGRARESAVQLRPTQPEVAGDSAFDWPFIPGMTPAFLQHFAVRMLVGSMPFSGAAHRRNVFEVAVNDAGPMGEGHLALIADLVPPIGLSHLTAPAPGSTLSWMLDPLVDRFDALAAGSCRVDVDLIAAGEGYTSQSTHIWGPGGEPLALGTQCMAIFG